MVGLPVSLPLVPRPFVNSGSTGAIGVLASHLALWHVVTVPLPTTRPRPLTKVSHAACKSSCSVEAEGLGRSSLAGKMY